MLPTDPEIARQIRSLHFNEGVSHRDLARLFNLSRITVGRICSPDYTPASRRPNRDLGKTASGADGQTVLEAAIAYRAKNGIVHRKAMPPRNERDRMILYSEG